ncbi:MAG: MFS transporter [Deltaproteobacteria bacterium]|nr:MFS transporter [Deltaproteobacteria bacterium]
MPSPSDKIYYGWYIVAVAFLANFISVGITFYIMNAFMEPLTAANNWSRTDVNMAFVYGYFAHALSQLLWGTVVMRTGPRLLMFLSPIFTGILFICLGYSKSLFWFYLYFVLINIGSGAFGSVVAGTAVNNWFVRKRGNAMGAATAGISMSGVVVPMIAMMLIIYVSLAGAFVWIGLATVCMGPVFWLVVRNWPEAYGLAPDGVVSGYTFEPKNAVQPSSEGNASDQSPQTPVSPPGTIWPMGRLIRNSSFWKVGIAFGFVLITVSSVMSQLKPRFSDVGFDDMTAMLMMSATALIGAAGKYIWGMLCDRYNPQKVVAVLTSLLTAGLMMALLPVHLLSIILFIIVFGFSMGGVMSTLPIIVADLFGRESFPAVFRLMSLILMIELVGYVIAGQSYDRTGSYNTAYVIFAVLDVAAVFLILTVKRPRAAGHPRQC